MLNESFNKDVQTYVGGANGVLFSNKHCARCACCRAQQNCQYTPKEHESRSSGKDQLFLIQVSREYSACKSQSRKLCQAKAEKEQYTRSEYKLHVRVSELSESTLLRAQMSFVILSSTSATLVIEAALTGCGGTPSAMEMASNKRPQCAIAMT